MTIIVDNTVTGAHFQGADANHVYIGNSLVFTPPPPIIHAPATISKSKFGSAIRSTTVPVFKRSLYPFEGAVIDISVAGDRSVLFQNNQWYSQHDPVQMERLPNDCSELFMNMSYMTHIDLRGIDFSNAVNMDYMFMGCINAVEIDASEMDTRSVLSMSRMFNVNNQEGHPIQPVNIKFGPKFVPTSLTNLQLKSTSNSTYLMFGFTVSESDPAYRYQIKRPWNPNSWVMLKDASGKDISWIYTSNSA